MAEQPDNEPLEVDMADFDVPPEVVEEAKRTLKSSAGPEPNLQELIEWFMRHE